MLASGKEASHVSPRTPFGRVFLSSGFASTTSSGSKIMVSDCMTLTTSKRAVSSVFTTSNSVK
ncbi:hypothetical protein RvY_00221 [Ramazzottius varieornatus]|uniref:Uncharacterized protein n=1 Tax=Ramazzottius varieornatus TaxID=947166 RepID=A0A1D1UG49_RAMVA|nr:hypothetical protein RvY_00221 [Ramazzottius varieornatus]